VIKNLFYTATTATTVVGIVGTCGPLLIASSVTGPVDAPDKIVRFFTRNVLRSAGIKYTVRGLEKIPDGPVIFVSNHQSHFDALVLITNLRGHIRYVAKAELFKIPLFGHVMKAMGNISVERSGGERDRRKVQDAAERVRKGMSVLFFPEGTRSEDGVLREFKRGAAVLAIGAQVPIVPLAVAGTRHILPKGTLTVHGGRSAVMIVGDPIPTTGLTADDRDALTQRARAAVEKQLAEATAEAEGASPQRNG
jgi:1-acyl-sn-glycerol-3-phosphate acyltransferase